MKKLEHKCIYVDIDGTLSNSDHRQHHLLKDKKDWHSFYEEMKNDVPHPEILWLVQTLYLAGNTIVIVTGRPEQYMEYTVNWLMKYNVPYDGLYMRPNKDNRSDAIVKVEMLELLKKEGFEPVIFLEDRKRVVDALRAKGYKVLQVSDGDF